MRAALGARRARPQVRAFEYRRSDGRHTTPTSQPSRFGRDPRKPCAAPEPAAASRSTSPARTRTRPLSMSKESAGSPDGAPIHWTAIPRRARGSAAQGRPPVRDQAHRGESRPRRGQDRPHRQGVDLPRQFLTLDLSSRPLCRLRPMGLRPRQPGGDASRVPLVANLTVDQDDGPVRGTRRLRAVRHQGAPPSGHSGSAPGAGKEHGRVLRVQVPGGLVGQDDDRGRSLWPGNRRRAAARHPSAGGNCSARSQTPSRSRRSRAAVCGSHAARPRTAPQAGRSRGR